MGHYFINDDMVKNEYLRSFSVCGRDFSLITSDGVFSKGGIDKGTGYLLEAALPLIEDGGTIVDLGCGYGVLGVVISVMKPGTRCLMIDINKRAVELANINAENNGVAGRARAETGDGIGQLSSCTHFVVTNPPFRAGKLVVTRFFRESLSALKDGGTLFAVLRKQQGAESYIKILLEIFGNCSEILKKKGYVVVKSNKSSVIDKP